MSAVIVLAFFFQALLFITSATADDSLNELDRRIEAKKAELNTLTTELTKAAGTEIETTHALQALLHYHPISTWITDISSPSFIISAQGVRRTGDLVYKPGQYKIYIEPERDSVFKFTFHPIQIEGLDSGIRWWTKLDLYVYATFTVDYANRTDPIHCAVDLKNTLVEGSLDFATATNLRVPYAITITNPDEIMLPIKCESYGTFIVKVNELAKQVSEGELDLGFASEGKFEVPIETNPRKYVYSLSSKDTRFEVTSRFLEFRANVDIKVRPEP